MKQLLILLMFSATTSMLYAQPWDSVTTNRNQIFTRAEVAPAFAGGVEEWNAYLKKNLNQKVAKKAPAGAYTVAVQFIVHTDGSLTDVKALTSHGYKMEAEAVRVIKNTPRWIPAKQNGHDVTCYHMQPITFVID